MTPEERAKLITEAFKNQSKITEAFKELGRTYDRINEIGKMPEIPQYTIERVEYPVSPTVEILEELREIKKLLKEGFGLE